MQLILLMFIIFYCLIRIVPSSIRTKCNEIEFKEEMRRSKEFYNKYVDRDETDKLYAMSYDDRISLFSEVLRELRDIIPEWKDLDVTTPHYNKYNNIFYDLALAKKGVLSSERHIVALSTTFANSVYLGRESRFFNIKPRREMAFGMSRKSYVALNKWFEDTLHANGCTEARLIYADISNSCMDDLDCDGYPKALFWHGFKFDFSRDGDSKRRLW